MPYESDPITMKLNDLVMDQTLYMDLAGFDGMNPAEQALIGTWELANEVYNGGFMQYFLNSSGEHAGPMIDVLRAIGADDAAAVLESAVAIAGPGTKWGDEPNYLKAQAAMPDDVKQQLRALEGKFFDGSDNLHRHLYEYLSRHRALIEAPDDFWTEGGSQ